MSCGYHFISLSAEHSAYVVCDNCSYVLTNEWIEWVNELYNIFVDFSHHRYIFLTYVTVAYCLIEFLSQFLLNSALLQKGFKVVMFFSFVFVVLGHFLYFLKNSQKASCSTNKYIQILLLWNLYWPASWNVRKVPDFVVSICRPWNSKWYNSSFGARSVSSFSWSFMVFFFSFYIWNILLLLVNNLCPMRRIFLQH